MKTKVWEAWDKALTAMMVTTPKARIADRLNCQHLRGYWISKARGNFRCYDCGFQFFECDIRPHDQRNIELWEPHNS